MAERVLQPASSQYASRRVTDIERRLRRLERRDHGVVHWTEYTPLLSFNGSIRPERIDPKDCIRVGWYADCDGLLVVHGFFAPGPEFTADWPFVEPDPLSSDQTWDGPGFEIGLPIIDWRPIDPSNYAAANGYWDAEGTARPSAFDDQVGPAIVRGPGDRWWPAATYVDDDHYYEYQPPRARYVTIRVRESKPRSFFGTPTTVSDASTNYPFTFDGNGYSCYIAWSAMFAVAAFDHDSPENPYEWANPFA